MHRLLTAVSSPGEYKGSGAWVSIVAASRLSLVTAHRLLVAVSSPVEYKGSGAWVSIVAACRLGSCDTDLVAP